MKWGVFFLLTSYFLLCATAHSQRLIKQSSTAQNLTFLMVSNSDHITAVTGLSPTVTLSKAGGSFASPSGAITEIGNGWYKVAGNATDTNTLGSLILHATGTGADPTDREYAVVAFDPQSASSLGLSNLDATVSSRSTYSGADTSGTTTLLSRVTGTVPLASDYSSARAAKLDNLDAAISTRSTYAGADTSGTTTLLSRLTSTRAGLLDNLDAAITTRSSHSAADVWAVATRALTDKAGFSLAIAPPTAAEIWGYSTRTLTGYGSLVADIWDEPISGHLTAGTTGIKLNSAGNAGDPWVTLLPGSYTAGQAGAIIGGLANIDPTRVTVLSPVAIDGGKITARSGDTWSIDLNGLGNIAGRTKLWFAINQPGKPDAQAKLFVEESAGLIYANGAAAGDSSLGAITVSDASAGDITVTVDESITALMINASSSWGVKYRDASGSTRTLATGQFVIANAEINANQ